MPSPNQADAKKEANTDSSRVAKNIARPVEPRSSRLSQRKIVRKPVMVGPKAEKKQQEPIEKMSETEETAKDQSEVKGSSPMPTLESCEALHHSPAPQLEVEGPLPLTHKEVEEDGVQETVEDDEDFFTFHSIPPPDVNNMDKKFPLRHSAVYKRHLEAVRQAQRRNLSDSESSDGFNEDGYSSSGFRRSKNEKERIFHIKREKVKDNEKNLSENGCPVYCSTFMTMARAQELIFKEDKDLNRCCSKIPNSYSGKYSVYLLNLQECAGVSCYSDLVEDIYGSWGSCSCRYLYFKYRDDGSVKRIVGAESGQTTLRDIGSDWDFKIQENGYKNHPRTKNLESQLHKKLYTVRYKGSAGEIVKTWAIIAYEWTREPLDIEFPPRYRGSKLDSDFVKGSANKRHKLSDSDYTENDEDEYSDSGFGRSKKKKKRISRIVTEKVLEENFQKDDEMKFSENGCPVYCSSPMTLGRAQQLIFKEDKDLDRCCSKIPNSYSGKYSVYLLNLKECAGISCYSDLAEDIYGTWGGSVSRCRYFKYKDDGSVERIVGGESGRSTLRAIGSDWDFSIQENGYKNHPVTKNLESQFNKKIYTVRYNGSLGEVVKTWAIIAYEWTQEPLDIEFPSRKQPVPRTGRFVNPRRSLRPPTTAETEEEEEEDDSLLDDESPKFSGNGCPVYSTRMITHKLAEELIFNPNKRLDLCCEKVPSGYVGRRSIYLLNLEKMQNVNVVGDLTVDSYGSWGSCNSSGWYYRYGDDGETIERIETLRKEKPSLDVHWDFMLMENSYSCHPQTRNLPSHFKRKVYTIRDKRAQRELVKTWAVIAYIWTGEPIQFKIAPHGSCRKPESLKTGYNRTRPTVRKLMQEKLQAGFAPRDVFALAHEEAGGVLGADTAADLPASKKQVYNVSRYLRKSNLIPDPKEVKAKNKAIMAEPWLPTEVWNPGKNKNSFMLEYDFLDSEPIALCADERMLNVFKRYCLMDPDTQRDNRPLYIDTTIELGPTCVTPVFTQHPELEEKSAQFNSKDAVREPIVPVAYLVSKNKSKDEFRWLGDALKRNAGVRDSDRVSAVITDDDPDMFGGLSECSLFDEPCCFILCGITLQNNVRTVLEECHIEAGEITNMLGQIFGREHQFSVDKGRHTQLRNEKGLIDCKNVTEFDDMLEEFESVWDPTFYGWFIRYKVPYIRNRFFVSGTDNENGWINANRVEAMKFRIQNCLQGNYGEDNIVDSLRTYSESVISKMEGAPFDIGEYRVKDEQNRWAVKSSGSHFNETPKAVRMARLMEFGLNKNPGSDGEVSRPERKSLTLYGVPSLSIPLAASLNVPLAASFSSRLAQCERAAARFVADGCVKQLKNKKQFTVEDVIASVSAIFVVERRVGGCYKCKFGFQVCEAFKMFRSCFCEHTVAVAEINQELQQHIDFINARFPQSEEVGHEDFYPEGISTPKSSVMCGKKYIVRTPTKKVIEVVNPLLNLEESKVSFGHTLPRSEVKASRPTPRVVMPNPKRAGYPTQSQLTELTKQKPLMFDGKSEHAFYNSNMFYLKQGSPPKTDAKRRCKKCKGTFVMPKEPGYMPPADMYIVHEEVDVTVERSGEIFLTEEEIPIYLHARYSCVAERYPYFYPAGYLKCDSEDRQNLQKEHQDEIRAQFGVSLDEILLESEEI